MRMMTKYLAGAAVVAASVAAPAGAAQFSQKLGASCVQNQHGASSGILTCARTGPSSWQWVETLPASGKTIRNGQWLVGSEIAPGRYRSLGAVDSPVIVFCSVSAYDASDTPLASEAVSATDQPLIFLVPKSAYKVTVAGCKPLAKIG